MLSRTHYYTTLFFVSLAVITWLALTPHSPRLLAEDVNDKLQHVTAFGWLMFIAHCSLPSLRLRIAGLALLGYGVLIEIAQHFIPTRSASLSDIVADLAGITIAAVLLRYACTSGCRV